jgi:uncharacterized repeat protein (TIGR03803 family)
VQGADGSFYGTTVYGGALNKGTVFRLTYVSPPTAQLVTRTAGMLRINWRVTPQINYQVQASGTLSQGTWQNEATPIRASGTELTTSHPIGTESRRFYRLQAQP